MSKYYGVKKREREKWIELARSQHQKDGEVEIDGNAVVSISDDAGAYVQAWVWVERERCECGVWLDEDAGEGYNGKCGNCADKLEKA